MQLVKMTWTHDSSDIFFNPENIIAVREHEGKAFILLSIMNNGVPVNYLVEEPISDAVNLINQAFRAK